MRTPSLIGIDLLGAAPSIFRRFLPTWRRRRVLGDPREEFTQPERIVISPPSGASTTLQAPKLVTVRGGERTVPDASFSRDTVYYKNPKSVAVILATGATATFESVGYLQVFGGSSQILAGGAA